MLVSPGAATDGVTLLFFLKKWPFFSHCPFKSDDTYLARHFSLPMSPWHLGNIKVDFTNYTVLLELDVILQLLLQSV